MGVISIILLILFIIASLLLIFLVAIQSEGGTGLGGIFGGGSDSTFGSQTGKVLNRFTAILGTSFLVLAILLAVINKSPSGESLLDSVQVEQVEQSQEWWDTTSTAE
ncbi:MAG: preprotein translocase subunit SecG [Sphaerochaetaceae bacterium]|jgi:preprotein translocase subunit SecG|nr:preprotein translocase subunit SecG [Sphaerochaetaceae bacterium]MDD3365835.1 preprotein translocase subunit SecG [Sphaerochaetaceae bacterium]MDD4219167.1 preprotein translocase subunit SecG [Sphaerochaetaceae bacterium]MDY0372173.1 preprotein translocase subunit SecG [Sphaerochaetaceae bacterium]